MSSGKRIVVVGAGAIGGYTGAHLARAGEDVTLVDAWPEHVEYMRKHGMQLSGITPQETHSIKVPILHIGDVQQLMKERPVDIVFICVKSYDTEWATHLIKALSCARRLRRVAAELHQRGTHRRDRRLGQSARLHCEPDVVGAVCAGARQAHGAAGRRKHTVYRVGEPHGRVTRARGEVAAMLAHVDSSKVTTNLWGERWSKLVINSMRNGLSAATGLSGNARDLAEGTRDVSIRLGSQAVRVGQALGFQLEKMLGMEPETLARAGEGSADAKAGDRRQPDQAREDALR